MAGSRVTFCSSVSKLPRPLSRNSWIWSDHQQRVADFAVGRGEVGVPEERHLLLERPLRVQHAVQPPELGRFDLAPRLRIVRVERERRDALVGGRVVDLFGVEEAVEGAGEAERGVLVQLGFGGAKAGPAQRCATWERVESRAMRVVPSKVIRRWGAAPLRAAGAVAALYRARVVRSIKTEPTAGRGRRTYRLGRPGATVAAKRHASSRRLPTLVWASWTASRP